MKCWSRESVRQDCMTGDTEGLTIASRCGPVHPPAFSSIEIRSRSLLVPRDRRLRSIARASSQKASCDTRNRRYSYSLGHHGVVNSRRDIPLDRPVVTRTATKLHNQRYATPSSLARDTVHRFSSGPEHFGSPTRTLTPDYQDLVPIGPVWLFAIPFNFRV